MCIIIVKVVRVAIVKAECVIIAKALCAVIIKAVCAIIVKAMSILLQLRLNAYYYNNGCVYTIIVKLVCLPF